jgi:hypothetical protein
MRALRLEEGGLHAKHIAEVESDLLFVLPQFEEGL